MTLFDMRDSLDHCVKCTICETACPFAAATPLFPGPKYVGPQAERFREGDVSADASLDYCSGCGICTQVCPQGVKIAEINAQARETMKRTAGIPLRDHVIARPGLTGRLGVAAAPVANAVLANPLARRLAEATLGIHRDAALPRLAPGRFNAWARRRRGRPDGPAVVYFHGCGADYYEPRVAKTAVRVLEHNGFRVVVPRQGCCGLPLQSNGLFPAARRHVRRLAGRLAPGVREGLPVVSTSTSCSLMLKRECREILGVDDEEVRLVGEATYDICEFLLGLHDRGELRTDFRPLPLEVPYHAPCQLRGHGIGTPAVDLLALVPELTLVPSDADCCGVAGTYGLKTEKYEVAMRVGEPLFARVREAGAEVAACDSETCRWHIARATGVPVVHPVELLYRAYGLGERAA